MKRILALFLSFLLISFQYAPTQMKAKHAKYQTDCLVLEEAAEIIFPFGKICADRLEIVKKEHQIDRVDCYEHIEMHIIDHDPIVCDEAHIDLGNKKVELICQNTPIVFSDTFFSSSKPLSYTLSSKKIRCDLTDNFSLKLLDFQNIEFIDNVCLVMEGKMQIHADRAHYQKKTAAQEDLGSIVLFSDDDNACIFTFDNNKIEAKKARIDFQKEECFLEKPTGTIANIVSDQNKTLQFSSDKLFWYHFDNHLIIKENVNISISSLLEMISDEIEVLQNHDHHLQKIRTRGSTKIFFIDKCNHVKGTLTSFNPIELDHEDRMIRSFCVFQNKGFQPIIYEDEKNTLSGNKAQIKYDSKTYKPLQIALDETVQFIIKNSNQSLGYGVADKILFSPEDKHLTLSALKDKKVLFWQDDRSLSLSADEITISKDPLTQKEEVQGKGSVRFSFNLEEETFFQNIFSQYLGK